MEFSMRLDSRPVHTSGLAYRREGELDLGDLSMALIGIWYELEKEMRIIRNCMVGPAKHDTERASRKLW